MSITKEDLAAIKARGFLRNRGTDCFSGRLLSLGGVFTADQLIAIAECSKRFGNGKIAMTSRLTAEIVGIPYDQIENAEAFVAEHGMTFGGTGAKVRPITACKGSTCVFGNIDTHAIAAQLHERFYVGMGHVKLPHKFKIGVGGCPNSCMKPSLNDVGIEGRKVFTVDTEKCRGCGKCSVEAACPMKAISISDGKVVLSEEKCINCGVCIGKCPFGAIPKEAQSVCAVYVGGTWGKTSRMGTQLNRFFSVEEAGDIVEKVLLWYRENGYVKERLGSTIDRIGVDVLETALASDDLLARREEIIHAPLKERP